jgi:exosortase
LIYTKRQNILAVAQPGLFPGMFLLLAGIGLLLTTETDLVSFMQSNRLTFVVLALVIIWIAGFILFFGTRAFSAGRFPLLLLFLLVPIPAVAIDKIIFFLQTGSAWVAYKLLQLLSVPVFKQGFELQLPTLDVEVAKECSGIRSSLALFISVLILSHFVLRSIWRQVILVAAILPVLVLKNAARIVTICLLSMYLDRRFLHGWLHTSGGILFYVLGLLALIPIVIVLRKQGKSAVSKGI